MVNTRARDSPSLTGIATLNSAAVSIPPLCVGEALQDYWRDKTRGMRGRDAHFAALEACREISAKMTTPFNPAALLEGRLRGVNVAYAQHGPASTLAKGPCNPALCDTLARHDVGGNMASARIPEDEAARLHALAALKVLDSAPEPEFDAIVQAAALVCGVPISLVSLVDTERQWFKANLGLPGVSQTPRDLAFCAHAILDDGLMEVPDALADPRFADNALVLGNPDIRFYAGVPLRLSSGFNAGTLCVIDRQPRQLDARQREILANLAAVAARALERRMDTRALAQSEERFRALSDGSPLGIYSTDVDGGCDYTNQRWQEIYGLTAEQSRGTGWTAALHPQDREAVFAEWQRCARERVDFNMEFRILLPTGQVRHVNSRARAVVDDQGDVTGFIGSVDDITPRVVAQQQLAQSEARVRSLYETTPAMLSSVDAELRLLTVSDEWLRVLGYTREEVIGRSALDFLSEDARQQDEGRWANLQADGRSDQTHYQMVCKSGRLIDVRRSAIVDKDADGNVVRFLAVHADVTDQLKAERAVVEQQRQIADAHERHSLATSGAGIGIWEYDLVSGTSSWDPQMYRLYGMAGQSGPVDFGQWKRMMHPQDVEDNLRAVNDAIANERPLDNEFRVLLADGTVRNLRAAARIVRDDQGKALRMMGVNWDVTQLRELSADLARQHEQLRVTLQSIGDAVITTDAAGNVSWLNPAAERMTGWPAREASGRPLAQVFHIVNEETRAPTENPVATCMQQGKMVGLANHTILISRDGEEFGIEDSAAPMRNEKGELLGVVLVFHDVTEQRRLSGEMSFRASHDALTGLVNRAEFEVRLRRALNKSHEDRSQHALMYIDLDQFKLVNDACGHSAGDQLLQQVSKLLTDAVRARDTLARLGGDEFAVILEHCTTDRAERVAQQICERMDDFRFQHDGRRFRIGTSIGLVPLDNRWGTSAAVMQAADTACYAAKEAGRNRVHTWFDTDAAMRARHGEMQWASRLEQAIDEDRFELYAQRIEQLHGVTRGLHAEVLVRMRDSDGSLVQPGAFLPAAERFHLASRIDRWVLRSAIARLMALPDLSAVELLCINLSGQSIGDRAFHRHALDILLAGGTRICSRLCLEITETAAVTNMADAALFIEQVRALGIRVALDDFGAGASSFGYLKTLKVDLLKIDGQFIRDLIDDPLDDAAVRCFVDVAKVVGVKTVAEFVDRPQVLRRVRELGIDYAQGFLLHEPEPVDGLLDFVIHTAPGALPA